MALYEIRDDLPIPTHAPSNSIYNFERMKVGSCMIVPKNKAHIVAASARQWAKRNAPTAKFISRKIDANTNGIWRTE